MSENSELVRSAYDAFGRGDVAAVLGLLGDRVEWDVTTVLPQGGSWRGREGAGEFFQGLGEAWADFSVEVEQLIDGGDEVVVIGRAAGLLRDSNRAAGYTFVHVHTVQDGQVVRFREWADPDEALREESG
jgi:ketosteroid isomerase-like protein